MEKTQQKREFPAFYEKMIPVAIGLLVLIIVVMIVVSMGVALGYFGG
jgi:hypothetical protein